MKASPLIRKHPLGDTWMNENVPLSQEFYRENLDIEKFYGSLYSRKKIVHEITQSNLACTLLLSVKPLPPLKHSGLKNKI